MIKLSAPAKINLTLEVLARREDGYHEIASIMHTLSLHDTLILTPVAAPAKRICIEVEGFDVPTDERNLVWRALETVGALAGEVGRSDYEGWWVRLIKRIPTEAGLGGGSSDAAAILRHFCLPPEAAFQLGADVPFFLNGACARVDGRGELVKPLPALPPFWWVLAKPMEVGVSTAWAYAQFECPPIESAKPPHRTNWLEQAIREGTLHTPGDLVPLLHNDFEAVVLPVFEPLRRLRTRMEQLGALRVLLCGSGAAQAALCPSQTVAKQMAEALRTDGYWAEAVQLGL
ncbi:MAG: 4-(cytidine 5'-diphospho)-2-C-methyl-D-erythritol kinase [Armatimonadota bacterium]